MKKIDLVILCGGKGTRLGKITKNKPKPLLNIFNKPFIDYLINFYQKYNIEKIYFLAGYQGNKIKKIYDKTTSNFIKFEVLVEKRPLGTGGALYLLKNKIKNNFILINGDSYVEYNFLDFVKIKKNFKAKLLLVKNKNYKSNNKLINLNLNNKIVSYSKSNPGYMNAGVYFFRKEILNNFKKKKFFSLEKEIIHNLILRKKVQGQITKGKFIDIGTVKNFNYANKYFFKNKKKAFFIDRDGVLNKDFGYVYKYSNFKWNKGILEFLKFLIKKNFLLFIVTNQSGIGRGYYSEKDFFILHAKIKNYLSKKNIFIDDVYYCPHHPSDALGKFKKKCKCRKPNNLMIKKIIKKWNISIPLSFMIGDKKTDEECAKKTRLRFFYYKENFLSNFKSYLKNLK